MIRNRVSTVKSVNQTTGVVTIESVNDATGTAVITVKVVEGSNYKAAANTTVSVNATLVTIYGVEWNRTSSGGVKVKEPKYYFKWAKTGKKLKLQIADGPTDGFSIGPVNRDRGDGLRELDYLYIGRYHCGSDYKSTTNVAQKVSITRSTARSGVHNLGSNFWQMDFAQFWHVNMLFLVEFADWNGERIGRGCSTSGSKMNNGQIEAMQYHTGTTVDNCDSYGFTQYRNIEGWWDNVYDWMDGCYYNSNGLNVISNLNNFSDSANGTLVGKPTDGYPSDFAIPTASGLEWALYPSANSGSQMTYVPDYWGFSGGYPCLLWRCL